VDQFFNGESYRVASRFETSTVDELFDSFDIGFGKHKCYKLHAGPFDWLKYFASHGFFLMRLSCSYIYTKRVFMRFFPFLAQVSVEY